MAAAITAVEEATWVDIDSPDGGIAPVAETPLGEDRLIVRRSRLVGSQASLWPDWRYHGFVTDRAGSAVELNADHRRHAVGELAIRDLKDGAGCASPRAGFLANAAWLVLGAVAHNLLRWTATTADRLCASLSGVPPAGPVSPPPAPHGNPQVGPKATGHANYQSGQPPQRLPRLKPRTSVDPG